jgi:MoaA/NifB/PqqE/SkfB family radical SAM enzyme
MSEFVRKVRETVKPIGPGLRHLTIELTERCNNDCIHCCISQPVNDEDVRRREMTSEQVKGVLQQAADLGCLQAHFTGGEPLLRPDFEELYLFARRLGMKVLLFTNARLITPHLGELFARIPPLEPIQITVYGMRQESYEAVTCAPGSFCEFRRGVNLLLERRVPFIVKSALLPPNLHEIDEFEAWAMTIPWMTGRPNYVMMLDLRDRRDNATKNRLIESLRLSPEAAVAVYFRDEGRHRKWTSELALKLLRPPGDRLFSCEACEGQEATVDAYGRGQPCMKLRAAALAVDVVRAEARPPSERDNGGCSLRDSLESFTHLRELRATNPEYLRRCAVCFLKGICEQCPGKSWTEYGTLDTPVEYLCEMNHALVRHLGWLGENERGWLVKDWWERVK